MRVKFKTLGTPGEVLCQRELGPAFRKMMKRLSFSPDKTNFRVRVSIFLLREGKLIKTPGYTWVERRAPLARERASELVDMFFLCMSPLSDEKANKKIQHKRGFGGGRVGVRYSTLLSFLMIMDKGKSSNICPCGKIGLIRYPVTVEIASSNLVKGVFVGVV